MKKITLLLIILSLVFASCTNHITVLTEDGILHEVADPQGYALISDTLVISQIIGSGNTYIYSLYKGSIPESVTIGGYTYIHAKATIINY